MTARDEMIARATAAWREWCRTIEQTGVAALEKTLTDDEMDIAEGLRYMARQSRMTLQSQMENGDTIHPYLSRALSYDRKAGGDNPQGLYLSAPINGTDTYRLSGTWGSGRWISIIAMRHPPDALAQGLPPYGATVFPDDVQVEPDGTFEMILSPEKHDGNWLETDPYVSRVLIRQFFGTYDDVRPMDLRIENLTRGEEPKQPLTLDQAVGRIERAAKTYSMAVPLLQGELLGKAATINSFKTDIGDPTSNMGGVPGGNAVTARWRLEEDEALLVQVTPPEPCAYWDVQVGNGWYETWDYRHFFAGLTCENSVLGDDGSVTLVLSQRDPGTVNWLDTAHHREGHIAIRWQLTDGALPVPACTVVKVDDVRDRTGLPPVSPDERKQQRRRLRESVERRFRL